MYKRPGSWGAWGRARRLAARDGEASTRRADFETTGTRARAATRAATDEGAVEGRARRARRHVTHRRRGEVRVELLHVDVGVVRLDVVHGLGHRRAGGGAGDFFSEEPKKRTRSNRRDGRVGGRGVRVERSKTRTRRARATRGARAKKYPPPGGRWSSNATFNFEKTKNVVVGTRLRFRNSKSAGDVFGPNGTADDGRNIARPNSL